MLNTTTFVGLDVHARSIKAVALDAMTGEVRSATFAYDAAAVAEWVGSLDPAAKCVYESGVTGFDLQKKLTALGVDCVIGAVSKMIKPPADRKRKNDRNDAEFLARMLSVGNVIEVWVPDDECEAARDLVRALDDARDDLNINANINCANRANGQCHPHQRNRANRANVLSPIRPTRICSFLSGRQPDRKEPDWKRGTSWAS